MFSQSNSTIRLPQVQQVAPKHGLLWIKQSFLLVREQVLTWALASLICLLMMIVLSVLPVLSVLTYIAGPVFAGSFVLMAHKAVQGGEIKLADLQEGFRRFLQPLSRFGLITVGIVLIGLMVISMVMTSMLSEEVMRRIAETASASQQPDIQMVLDNLSPTGTWIVTFLALVLVWLVMVLGWLAVPLIVQDGMGALAAVKMGFRGLFLNWIPLLLCSLAMWLLTIPAILTLGLGFLIWLPVSYVLSYMIWRDVFVRS